MAPIDSLKNLAAALALFATGLLATGCAVLSAPAPRPISQAITEVDDTRLAHIVAGAAPADQGPLSGFRLLPEAGHAFDARIALARRAEKSLDARNIANEYFMRSASANFIDLDVLASGPVVRELSNAFDAYWNSEQVYPIGRVARLALEGGDAARKRFDEPVRGAVPDAPPREHDILGRTPLAQQLDSGVLDQIFAHAQVFVDSPAKVRRVDARDDAGTVTASVLKLFAAARSEVSITSPYFIPGESGLAMMRAGAARGGRIRLLTNSLGATDEPLVYWEYTRYREDMP